jgi:hypothetical protein
MFTVPCQDKTAVLPYIFKRRVHNRHSLRRLRRSSTFRNARGASASSTLRRNTGACRHTQEQLVRDKPTPRRCSIEALVQPRWRSALMPKVFGEGFILPVTYCPADKCANLRHLPTQCDERGRSSTDTPSALLRLQPQRIPTRPDAPLLCPQNKVKLLGKSNDGRPAPMTYLRRYKIGVARFLKVFAWRMNP